MKIYADHAATTKMSKAVIALMTECMENIYGNPSSLHGPGQRAAEVLAQAREKVAVLLGAEPGEIFFTSGGSEADNQAIRSAALSGKRKGKTHLISTEIEHHAVLHTLKKLEEHKAYESGLRDALIAGLSKIPHARLNGDRIRRLPGNVNFCFEGIEGEALLLMLNEKGIAASSGSACASGSLNPSHVLLALALTNKAVAEALDGLPAHKMHCSVLAEEAVRAAVKDYYDKNGIAQEP